MLKKVLLSVVVFALICPVMAIAQEEADSAKTAVEAQPAAITIEAQLCTGVEERMPVGMADQFPADVGQVCLWTKILGYSDTTVIKHIWYYRGDEVATVELPVRGSSWRTYSYKTIPSGWTGDWVVKVVDADGEVLGAYPFKVAEAEAEPAMEKTAEPEMNEAMEPAKEKAMEPAKEKAMEPAKEEAPADTDTTKEETDSGM